MLGGFFLGILFGLLASFISGIIDICGGKDPWSGIVVVLFATALMSGRIEKFVWQLTVAIGIGIGFLPLLLVDPRPIISTVTSFCIYTGTAMVGLMIFNQLRKERD